MRQMQKIILKICNKGINAKQISKNVFELIHSFDDLITLNGYRDSVTMSQLETFLEMDSTDEKMHKKMRMIREKEAKEIAKKHQKEIAKKNKLEAKLKKEGDQITGFEDKGMGGIQSKETTSKISKTKKEEDNTRAPSGKGMKLGKPKKIADTEISKAFDFGDKEKLFPEKEETKEDIKSPAKPEQIVHLKIEEISNCEVNKFGDVTKFNIKGTVSFLVEDTGKKVTQIEFVQPQTSLFKQFKIHPEIDKNSWKDRGMLIASDQESGFIPGSKIEALIYKYASELETQLPFSLNIFITKAAGGKNKVSLELEFTENSEGKNNIFRNIQIGITVEDEPKLIKIENSTTNLDQKSKTITWLVEDLNESTENPILQFYTTTAEEVLYPLKVSFEQENDEENTQQLFIRYLLI